MSKANSKHSNIVIKKLNTKSTNQEQKIVVNLPKIVIAVFNRDSTFLAKPHYREITLVRFEGFFSTPPCHITR